MDIFQIEGVRVCVGQLWVLVWMLEVAEVLVFVLVLRQAFVGWGVSVHGSGYG